jgi:hypothetical protein
VVRLDGDWFVGPAWLMAGELDLSLGHVAGSPKLAPMTHSTQADPNLPEPHERPTLAVVVIAHRDDGGLSPAIQAAGTTLAEAGIEVLALVPASTDAVSGRGGSSLTVRLVAIGPGEGEAVWRARALAETAADIVEFVDDRTVALVPWDDVAPIRTGLVRLGAGEPVDVRAVLERLAVPDPDQPPVN